VTTGWRQLLALFVLLPAMGYPPKTWRDLCSPGVPPAVVMASLRPGPGQTCPHTRGRDTLASASRNATLYLPVERFGLPAGPREILYGLKVAQEDAGKRTGGPRIAQSNPRNLVSRMVEKELEAQKQPRYWMYVDSKKNPAGLEVSRVVETPQCWLSWPLSINGHPPTEGERKHAREQIEHLVSDSDVRKKNRDEIDSDRRKSGEMLKMLPDAFLFVRNGRQGKSIRLKFRPNPEYHPTTNESKVFHNMVGVLLIDAKQTRLEKLSGTLASDVDFGFGILGKLEKGGTFEVTQSEVAAGDWEVTSLDVHISGRALFFHTIGEQQHEVKNQFKPVPPDLPLEKAAAMATKH